MKRLFSALLFALSVLASGISSAARSDLNGDGRSDILWYHSGVFGLISMNANGLSLAPLYAVDIRPGVDWEIRGVADLNGDGKADIVWRNKATGEVYGLLMNGGTVLAQGSILLQQDLNQDIASVTDVDGDGKADLVFTDVPTGALSVRYLDGLLVTRTAAVEIGANPARKIVASGDLNGDGRKELFWRDEASGAVNATFLAAPANAANAAAGTDLQFYLESNANWKVVGFDDFNGDGKTDVLWRNSATGDVFLMLMDGTSVASGRMIYGEPNQDWSIVATGDYDGNGKADIVWRNMATGTAYMMLMDGFTIASQGFVYTEPDRQWQIVGNVVAPSGFRSMVKGFHEAQFKLTPPASYSNGAFTFESSNYDVADVASDGSVYLVDLGTVTLTAVQAATAKFPEMRTTATLVVEKGVPQIVAPDEIDQAFASSIFVPVEYPMGTFAPYDEEYVVPTAALSDPAFGGLSWDQQFRGGFDFFPGRSGAVTLTISLPERKRWKAAAKSIPVTLAQVVRTQAPSTLLSISTASTLSDYYPDQYVFDPQTRTVTLKMCPPGGRTQAEDIIFDFKGGGSASVGDYRMYLNGVEAMKTAPNVRYSNKFIASVSNVPGALELKHVTQEVGDQTSGVKYLAAESTYTVNVEYTSSHASKCIHSGPQ